MDRIKRQLSKDGSDCGRIPLYQSGQPTCNESLQGIFIDRFYVNTCQRFKCGLLRAISSLPAELVKNAGLDISLQEDLIELLPGHRSSCSFSKFP